LPGRTLVWSMAEGFRERRYWQLPVSAADSRVRLDSRPHELRSRLQAVVHSHLMSDVPLGLFLSGGLDSSALAALMAPLVKDSIRTFSVGFAEPGMNEFPYARLAASAVGAEHREVVVSPEEFFKMLPHLVWHEDEPIAFDSSVPLYFVSRLAREPVKGVLTARDSYATALRCYEEHSGDVLERMSHADLQTYLVELLMKQDQMSMAASIESRVPFLDHKLVEQVTAMPGHVKLTGWRTKAVLRDSLRGLVPREILTRRKMGFPVPLGR